MGAVVLGAGVSAPARASAAVPAVPVPSVLDFGAKGDGVTDDTAAVNAALARGGLVYFPAGTYLVARLTAGVAGTWLRGDGPSTVLRKNASGPVLTLNGSRVRVSDLTVDGNGGAFGGTGIVSVGVFPHITGVEVRDTLGSALVFPGSGAGHSGIVSDCILQVWQGQLGQANANTAAVSLPDDNQPTVQASNRQFTNLQTNACLLFTDAGSQNTKWVACTGRNFVIAGTPAKLLMSSCRLATSGVATAIQGVQCAFSGNAFAGNVTLKATFSTFMGNVIAGSLTIMPAATGTVVGANSGTATTDLRR